MATIISTKTSGVGGLEVTGDATGILQLASNNGTTGAELDASQNLKFNSGYGSVATAYGCRAWVNFNGTGTVAINASGNVTSITDNGVGDYTINITTAMPDINYSVIGSCNGAYATSGAILEINTNSTGFAEAAPTTTTCRILTRRFGDVQFDAKYVNVGIFR